MVTPLGFFLPDGTIVKREEFRHDRDEFTGIDYIVYECVCGAWTLPEEKHHLAYRKSYNYNVNAEFLEVLVPGQNVELFSPIYWYYMNADPYSAVRAIPFVKRAARIRVTGDGKENRELLRIMLLGNIPVVELGSHPTEVK